MTLEFHPKAQLEATEAYDLYVDIDPKVGSRFMASLDSILERAVSRPLSFPLYLYGTRRALLKGFPYQVILKAETNRIRVLAVAHDSRRPGYWSRRS